MEQTITQSGALFAVQHKSRNGKRPLNGDQPTAKPPAVICTLRTSVGEFALRPTQFGYQLEIRIAKVCRLLGVYATTEAAVLALRNRRTGFQPWDLMGRNAVSIQVDTDQRWKRNGLTTS